MAKKEAKTNTRARPKGAGRQMPNMPPIDDIRKLAEATKGNKSKVAEMLGVTRYRLLQWEKEEDEIREIFHDQWARRLDIYLDTAHILAVGQADKDEETGKMVYTVPPDPNMLRFMIEKYGKMEGFGQEVTVNANVDMSVGVPIGEWIKDHTK
jgi:bacterial regulatory protein, fis family|nr:MAG TPA: Sf6 terminase small subunit gp1, octamer, DNA-binding, CAPS buffer.65A [Caudoviricetes sp.]